MKSSLFFSLYESVYYAMSSKPAVEHVEQLADWDCGHTCLRMVIQFYHNDSGSEIQQQLWSALQALDELSKSEKPLWTIDLFVYLRTQGVVASFHTVCATGSITQHADIEWYRNTNLVDDSTRVSELFKLAAMEKWPVQEESLSLSRLQGLWTPTSPDEFVETVVIILVDSLLLNMSSYAFSMLEDAGEVDTSRYAGHYILLIGFSAFRNSFMYLDPAKSEGKSL